MNNTTTYSDEISIISIQNFYEHEDVTFVECDGLVYPLTPCCKASAKGSEDGIVCRNCYNEIDVVFGMCWDIEEYKTEFNTES